MIFIGAADGPTSIIVAGKFAQNLLGQITIASYSYMSLVPIIMPPVIILFTTKNERKIRMKSKSKEIPRCVFLIFPVLVTVVVSILIPEATALIGFLMLGNLIKECGVLEKLSKTAQNELSTIATLLLSLGIGATMSGENFLTIKTLLILLLGLTAFIF